MSADEQRISFLNNYFIYKKIRNPNARELFLSFTSGTEEQQEDALSPTPQRQQKRKVQKYRQKVRLPK